MVWLTVLLIAFTALPVPAFAHTDESRQALLERVKFEQRLDAQMPLDSVFMEASGDRRALGELLEDRRPAILVLSYFSCENLCDTVLDSALHSLNQIRLQAGRDFNVLVISIDPSETAQGAAKRKADITSRYFRDPKGDGWRFLTGGEEDIRRVADTVGFGYAWDPRQKEFLHAAGIVLLTPEGRVARYLFGVNYPIRELRLGLVEASENHIGSPVDQLLLRCFRYDPSTGRYSLVVMNVVRIVATAMVVLIAAAIGLMLLHERRARRLRGAGE